MHYNDSKFLSLVLTLHSVMTTFITTGTSFIATCTQLDLCVTIAGSQNFRENYSIKCRH